MAPDPFLTARQRGSLIIRSLLVKVGLLVSGLAILASSAWLLRRHWDGLSELGIEGLLLMFLLAWALVLISTPFFAGSMSQDPKDLPEGLLKEVQLYLAVGGITFVALSAVFSLLWVAGWVRALWRSFWASLW